MANINLEQNNNNGFVMRNIRFISVVLVVVVLIIGGVFICLNILNDKKSSDVNKDYQSYKAYYTITSESSDDDIKSVIETLSENEKSFSVESPAAVRINFYKADLYDKIKDNNNQISSLEKVVNNAKKENYLLPISMYNLAILYEGNAETDKAIDLYNKNYDTYKKDSELSDRSLFALYRIYFDKDKEKAKHYKDILEKDFENSEYAKFLLKFV